MKIRNSIILLNIILLISTHTFAQTDSAACRIDTLVFSPGEKAVYKVYYNWRSFYVGAGEVSFETIETEYEDHYAWHLLALGRTYKRYDWFFKVRDRYESFINPETLLPFRFIRDVYEGGFTLYRDYSFYHEQNTLISKSHDFKTPESIDTFEIEDCTMDILTAVYYARCIDYSRYKPNDTIPFSIFLDNELYHIYIRYLGKERIETEYGLFSCLKIKPLTVKGSIFTGGELLTVWVTDDALKVPVLVETPILVGYIKGILINYTPGENSGDWPYSRNFK